MPIPTLALLVPLFATPTSTPAGAWDARAVEHLYNRAGFGARPHEVAEGVAMGRQALVERLVRRRADVEPPFVERIELPNGRELRELAEPERQKLRNEVREKNRRQLLEYGAWWFERMQSGEDPLLEKMTLFWHGFFTTSAEEVKSSWLVLRQAQMLRENALGSYATLLEGIARDPAMLVYLDNQSNRKGNPNENFARELMELFSLGVGNYGEQDVKEAARALTGRQVREGEYAFVARQHDAGEKTVLGQTGKLDGDGLVKILLAQDACARHVARRLIGWFEGVEPDEARLASYADALRSDGYQIAPFLERLFQDPAFYRDEVRGARVQGPVEYMVGSARRLGTRVPPTILASGAALCGQRLFAPPSVKGWDEGESWITTSSLMQRGNLAGLMLGVVGVDDVLSDADLEMAAPTVADAGDEMRSRAEPMGGSGTGPGARGGEPKGDAAGKPAASAPVRVVNAQPGRGNPAYQALRRAEAAGYAPAIHLSARMQRAGAATDVEIVARMLEELLAIEPPADTARQLREFVASERATLGVRDGHLFEAGAPAEHLLRRLAHLILSLPEAQLS